MRFLLILMAASPFRKTFNPAGLGMSASYSDIQYSTKSAILVFDMALLRKTISPIGLRVRMA